MGPLRAAGTCSVSSTAIKWVADPRLRGRDLFGYANR